MVSNSLHHILSLISARNAVLSEAIWWHQFRWAVPQSLPILVGGATFMKTHEWMTYLHLVEMWGRRKSGGGDSHCLKIIHNVSLECFNFGIFRRFLSSFKIDMSVFWYHCLTTSFNFSKSRQIGRGVLINVSQIDQAKYVFHKFFYNHLS